ncbi:MAG: ABC transporter ATP-binding protein [Gammaproteobacteria bacterium]
MTTPLLAARGLTIRIAGKCVCRDFSLELDAGVCLGLLGPNGAGKTTFLHTLAGLRAPAAGEIFLAGTRLKNLTRRQIAQRLGLLMQQPEDSLPATVLETALIGRHPHIGFWRWESHADVQLARRALKLVGLDGLEQRSQNRLSGGERRRLDIATIVTQDPQVLLLDEPAQHLDLRHQIELLGYFRRLARERGRLVLMSLHDVNLAARFCNQVLLLFGAGETLLGGETTLNAANLSRLYGTALTAYATASGTVYLSAAQS